MAGQEERLPLAAEEVTVGRRAVETGRVRIAIETVERAEPIDLTLAESEVSVERVQVGRFVDEAPAPRVEGDVTVYPVLEERAVVTVRLFLREELHVRTTTVRHAEQRTVTLRSQQATVTRPAPANTGAETDEHPISGGHEPDE